MLLSKVESNHCLNLDELLNCEIRVQTFLFEVDWGWIRSLLCFTRFFISDFWVIRRDCFWLRFVLWISFRRLTWFILWLWRNRMKIRLNRLLQFRSCRSRTLTSFWSWRRNPLISSTKRSLNFVNVLPHIFFDFHLIYFWSLWRFLRNFILVNFNFLNNSNFFLNIKISRRSRSSILKCNLLFFNLLWFLVSSRSFQLWFLLIHLDQVLLEEDLLLLWHNRRERSSFLLDEEFFLILLISWCLSLNHFASRSRFSLFRFLFICRENVLLLLNVQFLIWLWCLRSV